MDPDEDPWAPLPPEDGPPAPHGVPAPEHRPRRRSRAMRGVARRRGAAPADAAAEQALADLQRRLAAAPRSDDPVRAALQRTVRREQAREQVQKPGAAGAGARGQGDPDGVADVAYEDDRDPREDEPWFRVLPPDEQDRLRAGWHAARHGFDDRWQRVGRRLLRAAGHGALLYLALGVLQAPLLGFGPLVPLVLVGTTGAVLAQAVGGGRFVHGIAGAAVFFAVMGPELLVSPLGMLGAAVSAFGMGAIGLHAEMERSGGFEQRAPRRPGPPGS